MTVRLFQESDRTAWDEYVNSHPRATLYHLSAWRSVIAKTYGHQSYYLMAFRDSVGSVQSNALPESGSVVEKPQYQAVSEKPDSRPVGILPLVHLKHFLFGNNLVSIPFFDLGGILADNQEIERALLSEAMRIGRELGVGQLELRHLEPLSCLDGGGGASLAYEGKWAAQTLSHKVRMILELPDSPEALMNSFKAKLRSQIRKPIKEGLTAKIGGTELLDEFYGVFCTNMRDLGSPVHSKRLIENVLGEFPDHAKIVVVYKDAQPLACSLVVAFRDILENPWASALREYSALSPNMLLYWTMLEYACTQGFKYFDFGRSTPDEGTYKFKQQWGAKPTPLHWQYMSLNGRPAAGDNMDKSRFEKAIQYWQKLPVPVTKILGPMIRKHISL